MGALGRWLMLCVAVTCLAVVPTFPALALLVRPILINMTANGAGSTSQIEVINDRNRPIAVEVAVNGLALPERGDPVVTSDKGDEFVIFPQIARIAPGQRQIFRVRWVGDPNLAESKLFMFATSELPVEIGDRGNTAAVQVLYAIQSVVAVAPVRARSAVSLASVRRATGKGGAKGLEFTFANAGAAHGFVTNARLEIKAGEWSKTLGPPELNNGFGLGVVPANARRVMFLAVPDLPDNGDVSASFELTDG